MSAPWRLPSRELLEFAFRLRFRQLIEMGARTDRSLELPILQTNPLQSSQC
jgi:hypothetical protein